MVKQEAYNMKIENERAITNIRNEISETKNATLEYERNALASREDQLRWSRD